MNYLEKLESENLRKNVPDFRIGDDLKVYYKIIEGEKERVQPFEGTLIARKGRGVSRTITLRKISFGEGVERTFPLLSPKVEKVEVTRHGNVRKAKLYYLRDKVGKKAKVKEKKTLLGKSSQTPAALATESVEVGEKA
ncbi:MAG: 50S ribosomal protein L19 [Chlamydiae bacterium]|nr:50S ribosomal protein L19 [Chlamydiota bacterium]MBI3266033.1 50S ribosomal protein L19 [Chlamydiota bacterium]